MKNAGIVPPVRLLPAAPPGPRPLCCHLIVFIFFCFFSHKFGKKVTYFNYLSELREHLKYDQLIVPPEVLR